MAAAAHSPTGMPEKDLYRIGEVSQITSTKSFVLRYWETEFPMLQPVKSPSGHRMYRREDIETVLKIKRLLYEEGFTIAGARKHLASAADAGNDRPNTDPSSSDRLYCERTSNPAAASRPTMATSAPFSSPATGSATQRGAEHAQASFLDNIHSDDQESDSAFPDTLESLAKLAKPEVEPPMAADFDAEAPIALEDVQVHFISRHTPFSDEQIHERQPAREGSNFSASQTHPAAPPPQGVAMDPAQAETAAAPSAVVGLSEEQRMLLLNVREELQAILTLLERE
ncbi:MAG: MerR family transcriptional regulator [Candidatus Acidiferrales bacterium]